MNNQLDYLGDLMKLKKELDRVILKYGRDSESLKDSLAYLRESHSEIKRAIEKMGDWIAFEINK